MPENIHDRIKRERNETQPDARDLETYRLYSRGRQDRTLTPAQQATLPSGGKHLFADNICDLILKSWASRLLLRQFEVDDAAVSTFLDTLYVQNQLADKCPRVNYAVGRDGNAALMLRWVNATGASVPVGPDAPQPDVAERPLLPERDGRVTVHLEPWWDGKSGTWIAYDDVQRPSYAVKDFSVWLENGSSGQMLKMQRRNVYFPDRIERYLLDGGRWIAHPLPGEDPSGIVPWTKLDGSPLGLPVVHLSFPRFGSDLYGESMLAGGMLALQDQINDVQLDITANARRIGFSILWATGVSFDTAPTIEPGTLLFTEEEAAAFGAIPAGDMTQLATALETKLNTVARNSSTPMHIVTFKDWPSGVALVQAERPLIAAVRELGDTLGPQWATLAHRATEIANAYGRAGLNEDALIRVRWSNPEDPDEMAQAETLTAQATAQSAIELLTSKFSLEALDLTEKEVSGRLGEKDQAAEEAMNRLTGLAAAQPQPPVSPNGSTAAASPVGTGA